MKGARIADSAFMDLTTGDVWNPFPPDCYPVQVNGDSLAILYRKPGRTKDIILWDIHAEKALVTLPSDGWGPAWWHFLCDGHRAIFAQSKGEGRYAGHYQSRMFLVGEDITATVIENGAAGSSGSGTTSSAGQGTPVNNGTLVTFTTTLGTIDPSEARTRNGKVTVKFTADGRSGTATITAFSGGTSGQTQLTIGTAGVKTVVLTANPQNLGPSGGTAQLTALVLDESGNSVGGVPVSFTTDAGTVQPTEAKSNSSGVATSKLTTALAANITATVGAVTGTAKVTLAPRTGIAITPPSSLQAGAPGSFTVTVGSSANVTNVKVNWGDGGTTSLGAITGSTTVQHTYNNDGSYTVTATATDSSGNSESVSTVMIVLPAPPVQVTLQASSTQPTKNQTVTFTATVGTLPAGAVIQRYDWNFGDGATTTTSSGNASHIYSTTGPKDISVTVTLSNGSAGQGLTSIVVTDSPATDRSSSPNPSRRRVGTLGLVQL